MTRLRLRLWVMALVLAGACADEAPQSSLPGNLAGARVPTGDPAGPRRRGVELVANPFARDPMALREGERLFREMNCADCHRYGGTGGIGPSLVDAEWIYGDTPFDRFSSVDLGRTRGMPAYGHMLPAESIWKVVAYIDELKKKTGEPGRAAGEAARTTAGGRLPTGGRP